MAVSSCNPKCQEIMHHRTCWKHWCGVSKSMWIISNEIYHHNGMNANNDIACIFKPLLNMCHDTWKLAGCKAGSGYVSTYIIETGCARLLEGRFFQHRESNKATDHIARKAQTIMEMEVEVDNLRKSIPGQYAINL